MEASNILQWMTNPELLNREAMLALRASLDEYPCFSIARVLYLKSLLNLNDQNFSNALIRTAISIPDRRRLYYFMEGKKMPDFKMEPTVGLMDTKAFHVIDRYLNHPDDEHVGAISTPKETSAVASKPKSANAKSAQPAQPEVIKKDNTQKERLVTDYARYLSDQPEADVQVEPMDGQDLIDKFLENSKWNEGAPKIKPMAPVFEDSDQVDESGVLSILDHPEFQLPEDSFTETLARIYLKQKRYSRAVEIFKSLCLKYPEKSAYFADQIRFLEKLIENMKK
jgi:hypothetical protein